jgi:uncharacterized membrane protein
MKKHFITGLVVLLPLAITVALILFLFNVLTAPFAGIIAQVLDHYNLLETSFFFISPHDVHYVMSQFFILIFLFFFTVVLGMIGRYVFFNYLYSSWNKLLHKIPLVSAIYKVCQDVIQSIFASKSNSFKQVVLVPFPSADVLTVGLVTQESVNALEIGQQGDLVAVFVPTTPNPTSGFLVMFPRKDLVYLDMPVENAFKYIISCGVIDMPMRVKNSQPEREI